MADPLAAALAACEREPIHMPGTIQPHGVLLGFEDDDGRLALASENAAPVLGRAVPDCLGRPVMRAPGGGALLRLIGARPVLPEPAILGTAELAGRTFHPALHRTGGITILELEEASDAGFRPADELYDDVRRFVGAIQEAGDEQAVAAAAADTVRSLTGFDRVLVYAFGDDWSGTVVAEARSDRLPAYLGLRFPASDIPAQARALYQVNRLRQIPDVDAAPVQVLAAPRTPSRDPFDMTYCMLRSVSPMHLAYMRNMGTAASMSVSVVVNGRLWGLVSCHHSEPRIAPLPVRSACDFIAQAVAMRIAGLTMHAQASERVELQDIQGQLLAGMAAAPRFLDGLTGQSGALLSLTRAEGAAVVSELECHLIGNTPPEADVRAIAAWLSTSGNAASGCFATSGLAGEMPGADRLKDTASGLIAIPLSQLHGNYLMWFRPEMRHTVRWGGDPHKQAPEPGQPLSPRRSFAEWLETVRLTSRPWSAAEIGAARGLRAAIIDIVLRKAEQLAELSNELERSNRELEAFSYSVSHDLRAPFRHIVGYAELLRDREAARLDDKARHYLDSIVQSAYSAGRLVDDLLSFAHAGRVTLQPARLDMSRVVEEAWRMVRLEAEGRAIEWSAGQLPAAFGDPALLRQVWVNLLSNAVKYTSGRDPARISVDGHRGEGEVVYSVADNGCGFDMAYVGKLFGVFQRLHRAEDFEGTGIGLANVRRIVERHGGRAWAEGELGRGAVFRFALPDRPER